MPTNHDSDLTHSAEFIAHLHELCTPAQFAACFVLSPRQDFSVVFCAKPAEQLFALPDHYSESLWFAHHWPKVNSENWREHFLRSLRLCREGRLPVPSSLQKNDQPNNVQLKLICFHNHEYVLCYLENLSEQPISEEINSYRTVLARINEPIGLFEVNAQNEMRVLWLNDSAYRYLLPVANAAGFRFIDLLPESVHESWRHFEHSLIESWTGSSISMIATTDDVRRAYEFSFSPLSNKRRHDNRFMGHCRDFSSVYRHEISETRRRQEFQNLVENSPDMIVRYDTSGRRIYTNKAFESFTGITRNKAIGKTLLEVSGVGKATGMVQSMVQNVIKTHQPMETEFHFDSALSNSEVTFELRVIPEFDQAKKLVSVMAISRDVTEKHNAKLKLEGSERRFRSLVENSPDMISRYDLQCRLVYANPVLQRIFGHDVIGKTPTEIRQMQLERKGIAYDPHRSIIHAQMQEVIRSGKPRECEVVIPMQGPDMYTLVSMTPEFDSDNHLQSVLVVVRDMTEVREYQERVRYLSKYDSLTGLQNRNTFLEKVQALILRPNVYQERVGFLVFGIDHFKGINDSLGYSYGDTVLKTVTWRLSQAVPDHTRLARLGGDEFGVYLNAFSSKEEFVEIAKRINQTVSEPVVINGESVPISVSIGACLYPDDALELDDLVRYADSALLLAKTESRGSLRFYSQDLTARALEQMQLRQDLRLALERDELVVYLQPKVNLATQCVIGAEALVRWNHPSRGLIFPDTFIPLAEDLGIICDLDFVVLDKLCVSLTKWKAHLPEAMRFAVNLSGLQFRNTQLVQRMQSLLTKYDCDPSLIEIEITEGVLLDQTAMVDQTMEEIKKLGISVALDDFGTGYSSLSYLSRYPIDTLKIDRSFIIKMLESKASRVLVNTIVLMAESLEMSVVAEGVEEQNQADALLQMGVNIAQGYLFSRPITMDAFAKTYIFNASSHEKAPNGE